MIKRCKNGTDRLFGGPFRLLLEVDPGVL